MLGIGRFSGRAAAAIVVIVISGRPPTAGDFGQIPRGAPFPRFAAPGADFRAERPRPALVLLFIVVVCISAYNEQPL